MLEPNVKFPLTFVNTRVRDTSCWDTAAWVYTQMPKVPPSFSSTVKDTWMEKFQMLFSAIQEPQIWQGLKGWQSWGLYLEESKYLLEISVLNTNKNVRTSKVEFEIVSFW